MSQVQVRFVPAVVTLAILVLSTSCFEDPPNVSENCWQLELRSVLVEPTPVLVGTDFNVSVEFEGEELEPPEEGWSLTYRLPRLNGEVCERTFEDLSSDQPPGISAMQLCQPEGQETLATLLPAGAYTVTAEPSGLCDDTPEQLSFPIQEAICEMAPGFDLLDLVVSDLGVESGASPAQFSMSWQVAYDFEVNAPGQPSQGTNGFNQTLTLRVVGPDGESFTHDEFAEGLLNDESEVFTVGAQSFDGFAPEQNVEYALRVEVDSGGTVLQCGEGVVVNDVACIEFTLPAQVTGTDCSAFEG